MRNKLNYHHTLKLYNLTYAIALIVIALVSFISQILIQNYLYNQQSDSHLINYAAKNRTDCQALVKYSLMIRDSIDCYANEKNFINTFHRWQDTYVSLRKGNDFLNIPRNKYKDLEDLYVIIDKPYENMSMAANKMCLAFQKDHNNYDDLKPNLDILLKNEQSFLLGMEMIVFEYDKLSRNGIIFLRNLEWLLFIILISCLILEMFLIFRPLRKKLKVSFMDLVKTEKYSRDLANRLKEANKKLIDSHKGLRELSFVLDKSTYLVKTDEMGNIIYANEKYCNVTRYSMSELIGKPLFFNNVGDKKSIIYDHINNEDLNKEMWQGEIFDHASDGTGFWMFVTLMPIFNNEGDLYRYYAICFDITREKTDEIKIHSLMKEKIKQKDKLQKIKSESIISGQERERKRISADIHDNIGQMLTALKMKLEMEESKSSDSIDFINLKGILSSIIKETRKICSDLNPNVLYDFGMDAALKDIVQSIRLSSSINVELKNDVTIDPFPKEIEISIFRIIQEAINNILKHAKAKNIKINIESDVENVYINIVDDGIGFDVDFNDVYQLKNNDRSYGLLNMKERAEVLNADIRIESEPSKGTSFFLVIPLT